MEGISEAGGNLRSSNSLELVLPSLAEAREEPSSSPERREAGECLGLDAGGEGLGLDAGGEGLGGLWREGGARRPLS